MKKAANFIQFHIIFNSKGLIRSFNRAKLTSKNDKHS